LSEIWLRAGELNATRMAYEASMTPVHLPAKNLARACGRTSGLSIIDRVLIPRLAFPEWSLVPDSNWLFGVQVRRIADYAYRA
jgi:hypothetical protein